METSSIQLPVSSSATLPKRPSLWSAKTIWLLLLLLVLGWSLGQAGVGAGEPLINRGGWSQFIAFWQAAFSPDLTLDFLMITLRATVVTLGYAVSGTFLSLMLGGMLGVLASEVWWQSVWPGHGSWRRGPWLTMRLLLAVPRGIHELLWGLFFLNIFGLDPLVAVLAIAIPYGATVAKVFADILEETPRRPYLALLHSGVAPLPAFAYALIPAAFADLLSYAFYRFECAIRAAAVLGIVGAGGLGYQILLSMQTLNYNEVWTLFLALMLLSGLADYWSSQVRLRLGRADCACDGFEISQNKRPTQITVAKDPVIKWSLVLVGILVPFSFLWLQPDWSLLWSGRSWRLLQDIAAQAWPLKLTADNLSTLWQLSEQTLAMSILAAVLAAAGGAVLSFPAARNFFLPGGLLAAPSSSRSQRWASWGILIGARYTLLLMRAIPAPIWAFILLLVFFPGILPGAIALGLYNLGILGRLMSEVTENQDERPSRALKAQGAGRGQLFFYGMLPATTPRYLAYSLYRWEIAIRATVVVGLVGAGGLGRALTQQLAAFNYRAVLATLIFYIGLTFAVDFVSIVARKTLR